MNKDDKELKLHRRKVVKQIEEKRFAGEKFFVINGNLVLLFLFISLVLVFFAGLKIYKRSFSSQRIDYSEKKLLKITFFDVRQGDCALISFPNGKNILIDSGAAKGVVIEESDAGQLITEFDAGDRVIVPYLKKNNINIEGVVITHHHSDHFGGLVSVIKSDIFPKWVMDNGTAVYHPLFYELLQLLKKNKINYKKFELGKIEIDPDVTVEILSPMANYYFSDTDRSENNSSIVLKIRYGDFSVLFTGDIEIFAEMDLLEYKEKLNSTVLKVPHHGSATSTSEPFLDFVLPKVAVISCGIGNPFGHPHEDTLVKLNKIGAKIYRTDYNGNIVIMSDGKNYVVNVEKEY